ncbi:MAG: nucleoside deaminase [Clostridia bacterium]|nr:nucleoside deaminase [Clostridia bacterium]
MWKDLSAAWQAAFEEAWDSFRHGSIPIGAVIADENGNVILKEHNRGNEEGTVNRSISHAEANALHRLDTARYDPGTLTLYTTMEPCPMCFGTAVMSNIKHVRYAARDPHCGFVHIREFDPYVSERTRDFLLMGQEYELVQLTLQSYHELRYASEHHCGSLADEFRTVSEEAVDLAGKLFAEKTLDVLACSGEKIGTVFDLILSRMK